MEAKTINVRGEIFQAEPDHHLCEGCAFVDDDNDHRCNVAMGFHDCVDNQVIWVKAGVKTGAMSKQVGGNHYQKKIQPWDIIHEWKLDYWRGNVIKYVLRCNEKNGIEDLKKAIHYLEYAIDNYEKDIK